MTTPTIIIPGIKGTTLVNTNTLDFDTIWSGIQSKFESSTIYKKEILTISGRSKWSDGATHGFFLNDGRVQTVINRFIKDDTQRPEWWSDIGDSVKKVV